MQINSKMALAKLAKNVAIGLNVAEQLNEVKAAVHKEFVNAQTFMVLDQRSNQFIAGVHHKEGIDVREEWGDMIIELGPFGYKFNNHEEYEKIAGAAKITPKSYFSNYEFFIPFGDDVLKTLAEVRYFYETNNYVARYQNLFGYTTDLKNTELAIRQFSSYYFGDMLMNGQNQLDTEE